MATSNDGSPLIDFLVQQPRARLGRLYGNPWTCQAVLRALPPLAAQYAMRLLFAGEAPVEEGLLRGWAAREDEHEGALRWLQDLSILVDAPGPGGVSLDPAFREGLQGLARGQQPAPPVPPNKRTPSAEVLASHAADAWDQLLLCIVNPRAWLAGGGADRGFDLPYSLLVPAGLLEEVPAPESEDEEDGEEGAWPEGLQPLACTPAGAAFVLDDVSSQVWAVARLYVGDDERRLAFLLALAHRERGKGYAIEDGYRELLVDLHHLGIVYIRSPAKSSTFYPTSLASAIVADSPLAEAALRPHRVVVESNFRVYVYTRSRAWLEVLRLFMRVLRVLPDVVVCTLTREDIQRAMDDLGVRASDLVGFLRRNAHPEVAARLATERDKAQTVFDQIRLWEEELNRFTARPALYAHLWDTLELFDQELERARLDGTHLWHHRDPADARKCKLVLLAETDDVKQQLRTRVREYKASRGMS